MFQNLFTEKFTLDFTVYIIHLFNFNNDMCKAFHHYSYFSVVFPGFMRFV